MHRGTCSNNTNKLSPQEQCCRTFTVACCSNNTNKLSPQEHASYAHFKRCCSNNTNKLSPQEQGVGDNETKAVQIIQINLVLKNR